ncbi:odorant receptor 94a-like [Haematobia irritans]|uniref:odorant receptor 94a-like n=1 Tax=Haematobia irritans TaxID=7368 RepID=UPI003F4FA07B
MAFDSLENLHIIHKLLRYAGLWTDSDDVRGSLVISLLVHGPLTFTYTLLMWMEVMVSTDIIEASDVLYMALTETALIVKIMSILRHRHHAKSMLKRWQCDEQLELQNSQERLMWKKSFSMFNIVSFMYIVSSLSVVISSFTIVLLLKEYTLPFLFWTPFDWHNPPYYWYAYLYGALAMPLTCLSNCTLDMWQCYIMQHLAVYFKVIAMRFQTLGRSNETHQNTTKTLLSIIKMEQDIKRMTVLCERIISKPVLAQILLSALVLCFSLYRLQSLNFLTDAGNCFVLTQYAICMILQIYLPCYYAHQLTLQSSRLMDSIYECNWIEMSSYNRHLIRLYMGYLRRPVILRAGKLFDIGLPVFIKTMNNAYSIFALLLNMDVK